MMPDFGEQCYEESFNSFLAGVLLVRRRIDNFSFFNLMNSFEINYNVDIVSIDNDIRVPIYLDDNEIRLLKDINDKIMIDGKCMTIKDYLYSVTTPRVRHFLDIPEIEEKIKPLEVVKKFPFVRILCKKRAVM